MQPAQSLKMNKADVVELDNMFRKAIGALFRHVTNLINTIRDCQGNECVDSVNAEIDGLRADVQYLVSEIKRGGQLTFVVDFARAMYEIFQYLARFGLLNTEYKEFLKKVAIDGGEFLTDLNKMQVLFVNAGRILTHAACMARYRGVSRLVITYLIRHYFYLVWLWMRHCLVMVRGPRIYWLPRFSCFMVRRVRQRMCCLEPVMVMSN